MATLAYGHTPTAISSPCGECTYKSAVDSITFSANFVHQVSQSIKVMIIMQGPRPGIDLETCSPQDKHAITPKETD